MAPPQKPGKSKQDYETPPEFLEAVKKLLGIDEFAIDLAASLENRKAERYIPEEADSLSVVWAGLWRPYLPTPTWCWLNPPYGHIAPWVKKCAEEGAAGVKIALLVPAAVGSNWYADYVDAHAYVFKFRPRLTFVGHTDPYPKDLLLCLYGTPFRGEATWDWKEYLRG